MTEKMQEIIDILVEAAREQLDCMEKANTEELGEVIDMIKDMAEAMYYCSSKK